MLFLCITLSTHLVLYINPSKHATVDLTLLIFSATLDAQICAKEEADGNSSDDEQGIKYKRESTNANNRKRRAVFDFSDDEEDENIISIASPEVLKQRTPDPVIETAEDAEVNQKNLENKDDVPNTEKGSSMGVDSDFTSECKTKTVNNMNHSGITLKEKSSDPPVSNKKQDSAVEPASTAPKRRKVLKTRIDERGREGSYTKLCKRHWAYPVFYFYAYWTLKMILQCCMSLFC
jgi:DNA polymerase delta subunit 3